MSLPHENGEEVKLLGKRAGGGHFGRAMGALEGAKLLGNRSQRGHFGRATGAHGLGVL